jgi:D-beta-D-heptose 7-phosphate kinase/D-beta-D-heptose 1-phosphate adenosyltransferase
MAQAQYTRLIHKFAKTNILVIGDLMVDRFVRGKVTRLSPEAPVPIVHVKDESDLPGGAGNVIMNLASLGAQVSAVGMIGRDPAGENLLSRFRARGIQTQGIMSDASLTTILKTRVIAEHQQVVRFDRENLNSAPHKIYADILKLLPVLIRESDGVILSDYGKGTITQPILTAAITLAKHFKKPICVDPKLEHFLSYKGVTCITPNSAEALGGMRRLRVEGEDGFIQLGKDILKALKCKSVLITQGEEGMTLFEKSRITHIPVKAREVFDVTGAGDTVISVFTLALACGASLVEAATLANLAAGIVVGKLGTATVSPIELRKTLNWI